MKSQLIYFLSEVGAKTVYVQKLSCLVKESFSVDKTLYQTRKSMAYSQMDLIFKIIKYL